MCARKTTLLVLVRSKLRSTLSSSQHVGFCTGQRDPCSQGDTHSGGPAGGPSAHLLALGPLSAWCQGLPPVRGSGVPTSGALKGHQVDVSTALQKGLRRCLLALGSNNLSML